MILALYVLSCIHKTHCKSKSNPPSNAIHLPSPCALFISPPELGSSRIPYPSVILVHPLENRVLQSLDIAHNQGILPTCRAISATRPKQLNIPAPVKSPNEPLIVTDCSSIVAPSDSSIFARFNEGGYCRPDCSCALALPRVKRGALGWIHKMPPMLLLARTVSVLLDRPNACYYDEEVVPVPCSLKAVVNAVPVSFSRPRCFD